MRRTRIFKSPDGSVGGTGGAGEESSEQGQIDIHAEQVAAMNNLSKALNDNTIKNNIDNEIRKSFNWTLSASLILNFQFKINEMTNDIYVRGEYDNIENVFKIGFYWTSKQISISVLFLKLIQKESGIKFSIGEVASSLTNVSSTNSVENIKPLDNIVIDVNAEFYARISKVFTIPGFRVTYSNWSDSKLTIDRQKSLVKLAQDSNTESRSFIESWVTKSDEYQQMSKEVGIAEAEKKAAEALINYNAELLETLKGIKTLMETSNASKV